MPLRLTLAGAFGLALLLAFVALSPPARLAEARQVGLVPPPVAVVGVTLIDGTGGPPLADMTVVVSGDRITALGTRPATPVPGGARTVDGRGKFLIPGLWDMHVHLSKAGEGALPLFIANGVTSVRDMGGDADRLLRWRAETAAGTRVGPRIKTPGQMLESATNVNRMRSEGTVEPVDRYRRPVGTAADAERAVAELASMGVDFIKIRTLESPDTYRAILEAAERHHLTVVGHPTAGIDAVIDAGQRSVEHALIPPLSGRSDEARAALFSRMAGKGIVAVPTLVVGMQSLLVTAGDAAKIVNDVDGAIDPRRKYVGGYLIDDWREQVGERDDASRQAIEKLAPLIRKDLTDMRKAGVRMMPGTDTAVVLIYPGFSLHDELEWLVSELGMTPMDAIVAATRHPAEFFGMLRTLGTVQVGKTADLVLLDASPLDRIGNTRAIRAVVAGGRLHTRRDLDKLLQTSAAAARAGAVR
jgi:imidazolonepropionase-like amidohydrolase